MILQIFLSLFTFYFLQRFFFFFLLSFILAIFSILWHFLEWKENGWKNPDLSQVMRHIWRHFPYSGNCRLRRNAIYIIAFSFSFICYSFFRFYFFFFFVSCSHSIDIFSVKTIQHHLKQTWNSWCGINKPFHFNFLSSMPFTVCVCEMK